MRHNFPRDFYLPRGIQTRVIRPEGTTIEAHVWEMAGKPYACIFAGKANKPIAHHWYRSAECRDNAVEIAAEHDRRRRICKEESRKERAKPHNFQVGHILESSWGYDQTNIDFYQVTAVLGPRMVEIRPIGQVCVRYDGGGSDKVVPDPDSFTGPPSRHVVNHDRVKVREWGVWASIWDGNPRHQTALGWGR